MTFQALVVRVLIASPGDVIEEREIATSTIQHWNDINSYETEVIILPMKWETHSSPEYRIRPQQAINEQVIDHCDIAIGIFWTRIGSSTGVAPSGTIEEIERVADAGKPVMLYFSRADAPLEKIDIDQLKSLREFESRTRSSALIEYYANKVDFRDKLYRQLDVAVKKIRYSIENEALSDFDPDENYASDNSISLEIANPFTQETANEEDAIHSINYPKNTLDAIQDFNEEEAKNYPEALKISSLISGSQRINPDYLREVFAANLISQLLTPIAFKFHNAGMIGFRDVYAEINFTSDSDFYITQSSPYNTAKPNKILSGKSILSQPSPLDYLKSVTSKPTSSHFISIGIDALQPKRILFPQPTIWIGSPVSCEVKIHAKIYADVLSEPLEISKKISISSLEKDSPEIFIK